MPYHVMEWQTVLAMEIDCNVNYIIISCIKFRFFVLAVPRQLHSGNFSDMNNYFEIAIRNSYSRGRSCCKEFSLNTRVFWSDVQYRMIEMCGIRGKSWRTHTHWRMEMKPNEAVVYMYSSKLWNWVLCKFPNLRSLNHIYFSYCSNISVSVTPQSISHLVHHLFKSFFFTLFCRATEGTWFIHNFLAFVWVVLCVCVFLFGLFIHQHRIQWPEHRTKVQFHVSSGYLIKIISAICMYKTSMKWFFALPFSPAC